MTFYMHDAITMLNDWKDKQESSKHSYNSSNRQAHHPTPSFCLLVFMFIYLLFPWFCYSCDFTSLLYYSCIILP